MNTSEKSWYLKQINLFKGIPPKEIMAIAQQTVEKNCNKKELLYTPFEKQDSICVLKKGEVTLYHSHHGKKIIIDVLKPGSVFGNLNFSDNKNNQDHFAEVTQKASICFFSSSDFKKIVKAKPEIMMRLITAMSDRLNDYEQRIKSNLFDAKEKIIHHLELIHSKNKKNIFNKLRGKTAKITHEKLAQHTGLSRETVTRAITALKKEGKITTANENNNIELFNKDTHKV